MTKYTFRHGFRNQQVDAQRAGEHLEQLRKRCGGALDLQTTVDSGRPKTSPIHDAFTWDDTKAAAERRLDQARYLLRSIEVVITTRSGPGSDPTEYTTRGFHHVNTERMSGYVSASVAFSDVDARAQVIAGALAELESWQQRYQEYSELATVFSAIAETRKRMASHRAPAPRRTKKAA